MTASQQQHLNNSSHYDNKDSLGQKSQSLVQESQDGAYIVIRDEFTDHNMN